MMSDLPKVAHIAAGKPMISWVLDAFAPLQADTTVVVLGHGSDVVRELIPSGVVTAVQEQQLGTGDAAAVGLGAISALDDDDTVVVAYGDMPLLGTTLLSDLARLPEDVAARMVTSVFADPTGYGRVIRTDAGAVVGIVEESDCSPAQRAISEINAGAYGFAAGDLRTALEELNSANAQGEFYLTDVVGILTRRGRRIEPVAAAPEEVVGINSQDQLAQATRLLQRRAAATLVEAGVWILDPDRTYIDPSVVVEAGARIYPGSLLEGETVVKAGARVGPDVTIVDSTIGEGSTVWYAVLRGATVGSNCEIGPFASLRPGTVIADGAKVGTFVETKNAVLGEGSKAGHLTYLGDVKVGRNTNIGAGTVTVNYDGVEKHETEIGDEVFIGSDTMLVAPVRIGDRATTGAGSVITEDVNDDALALERAEQKEIPGYSERRERRRAAKRKAED